MDAHGVVGARLGRVTGAARDAPYLTAVTDEERLAIRTTRSITARTGCRSMNDDLFWAAVTQRVPEILERVIAVPGASGDH